MSNKINKHFEILQQYMLATTLGPIFFDDLYETLVASIHFKALGYLQKIPQTITKNHKPIIREIT